MLMIRKWLVLHQFHKRNKRAVVLDNLRSVCLWPREWICSIVEFSWALSCPIPNWSSGSIQDDRANWPSDWMKSFDRTIEWSGVIFWKKRSIPYLKFFSLNFGTWPKRWIRVKGIFICSMKTSTRWKSRKKKEIISWTCSFNVESDTWFSLSYIRNGSTSCKTKLDDSYCFTGTINGKINSFLMNSIKIYLCYF
jgi:hypothetical protein